MSNYVSDYELSKVQILRGLRMTGGSKNLVGLIVTSFVIQNVVKDLKVDSLIRCLVLGTRK